MYSSVTGGRASPPPSPPLSPPCSPDAGANPPERRRSPSVAADSASSLAVTRPATPASMETLLAMPPVARCLAASLPTLDLLNLRHNFAPGSQQFATITQQVTIKDSAPDERMLARAVHCLSCPRRAEDQDLRQDLQDALQDSAFFSQDIEPLYGSCGQPLPDPVRDSPQQFASRCRTIDKAFEHQWRIPVPCAATLLKRALENADVAMSFRLLQMLQALRQQGALAKSLLENRNGATLLIGRFFHSKLGTLWRRLVLAAAVFDLHPRALTPLGQAIRLGPDAQAVELLLEAGAHPDHGDYFAPVPLTACLEPSVTQPAEKMAALLRYGANPNQIPGYKDHCAAPVLHQAVSQGLSWAVCRLLAHPATDPDLICPWWCGSPLAIAAADFLVDHDKPGDMVRLLTAQGCRMLIHTAVMKGAEDCGDNLNALIALPVGWGPLSHLREASDERKAQLAVLLEEGRMAAAKRKIEQDPGDLKLRWQESCRFL